MEGGATEEYTSCEWIEGGLAFNRRSLHTCLIVHHGTGFPFVSDFEGGPFPLEELLRVRAAIREANRHGEGHPACRGCVHLKKKAWPRSRHAIELVGIAHYSFCNIKCDYCFLQTQDPASFAAGFQPYPILPAIRAPITEGHLAPNAIIDWGGGEPTYYKEFDELLDLLLAHGTLHFLHTNGTHLPESVRRATAPQRVHAICSIDAGTRETYLRIKKRDYLERVWANLQEYARLGCRVTLKYITRPDNCAETEIGPFLERVARLRPFSLIADVDYNDPHPGPEVIAALARLVVEARRAGVAAHYGFTGEHFAPDHGVAASVEAAVKDRQQGQHPERPTILTRLLRLLPIRSILPSKGA